MTICCLTTDDLASMCFLRLLASFFFSFSKLLKLVDVSSTHKSDNHNMYWYKHFSRALRNKCVTVGAGGDGQN